MMTRRSLIAAAAITAASAPFVRARTELPSVDVDISPLKHLHPDIEMYYFDTLRYRRYYHDVDRWDDIVHTDFWIPAQNPVPQNPLARGRDMLGEAIIQTQNPAFKGYEVSPMRYVFGITSSQRKCLVEDLEIDAEMMLCEFARQQSGAQVIHKITTLERIMNADGTVNSDVMFRMFPPPVIRGLSSAANTLVYVCLNAVGQNHSIPLNFVQNRSVRLRPESGDPGYTLEMRTPDYLLVFDPIRNWITGKTIVQIRVGRA